MVPKMARELLELVVFLPLYPEEPDDELKRLANVIAHDLQSFSKKDDVL